MGALHWPKATEHSELSHDGTTNITREAELRRPTVIGSGDLLGANVITEKFMTEKLIEIVWERRDEETMRGYLSGHPETTLFLLVVASPDGRVKLQGAFVPDADEQETWDIQNAKTAAHVYMRDWLEMFASYQAPNASSNYSETPRTDLAEENLRALGGAGYVRASHARELERELIVKSANYALAHSNLGREVTKCGQLTCDVRYWRDIARRLAENGGGLKRYDSLKYADTIAEYKRSAAIYEAQEIANQELAQERGEESDAATETANRGRAV